MKHYIRTLALRVAFLLLTTQLFVPLGGAQAAQGPTAKPNIVIMLVDDMGVMDTSRVRSL